MTRHWPACTLWAPACTTGFFAETYRPLVDASRIARLSLYTLTDAAEQDDDCRGIYHKSRLYLVRNAFEAAPRIQIDERRFPGTPLLGLERDLTADAPLLAFVKGHEWVRAPDAAGGGRSRSDARHHGDFDDDVSTVKSTLAAILGKDAASVGAGIVVLQTRRQQVQEVGRLETRRTLVTGLRRR